MNLLVDQSGDGLKLTLLHGWAMHSGLFGRLTERLKNTRIQLLDLPGHGRQRTMPWPDSADTLVDSIVESAADGWLLGWSLGGLLAMQAALAAPRRIRGLILIASTPCFSRRPSWPHGVSETLVRQLANELSSQPEQVLRARATITSDFRIPLARRLRPLLGREILNVGPATAAVSLGRRNRIRRTTGRANSEVIVARALNRFLALEVHGSEHAVADLRLLRAEAFRHGLPDQQALEAGLNLLRQTDLSRRLSEIELPVMLIGGRRDQLVPFEALQASAERLPQAELVRIPGAAHAPFLTNPAAVADAITSAMAGTTSDLSA